MKELAILIPTYKRAARLEKLIQNIETTTHHPHSICFIVESDDIDTIAELKRLKQRVILNKEPNTYVSAINTGYRETEEPFVLCGSDDIVFSRNWDIPVIKAFSDKKIGIVGSIDSWKINQTGCHSSHFTVRREYIEKHGGVHDEKNTIYSSAYRHYHCDVETLHTAMHRQAFIQCPNSRIEHNHYTTKTAEYDETYARAKSLVGEDNKTFESRRNHFEYWHYGWLWRGKKYRVNQSTLSIVIPSYNVLPHLKTTIDSLYDNTYHRFELIIIDDNSDEQTKQFLKGISKYCTVIFNQSQQFVTKNWNTGVKHATGEYIAILNNDIRLPKDWDVPLMNALDEETWVSSPYLTDSISSTPFKNTSRFEKIELAGPCFMLKRQTFEKTGLFPETTKIWYNDLWLSWKINEVLRKKTVFVPEVVVHHFKSQSTGEFSDKKRSHFLEIVASDKAAFNKIRESWEAAKK